jgi:hypothetical protein
MIMATRANTSKSNWGKIADSGMGGFLNPPAHPEHTKSIVSFFGDTFSISLSAAVKETWLDDETRNKAKRILSNWKPPDIESPEVQEWILKVLGYFKNCYQSENGSWDASDLRIVNDSSLLPVDKHAGVYLIRKYYHDFTPTKEHFDKAYWGTKPE